MIELKALDAFGDFDYEFFIRMVKMVIGDHNILLNMQMDHQQPLTRRVATHYL